MADKNSVFINNSAPSVDDTWLNMTQDERDNIISASGLTPTAGINDQGIKAMSTIIANADYYTDGGGADAYVLSVISPNIAPQSYRNGMRIRFRTSNTNTGASTVNVAALGVKNIKLQDGVNDPLAAQISVEKENVAIYDGTSFRLESAIPLDKYFINGFVPTSSAGVPDEDIDITAGNALAKDGYTILSLVSSVANLDLPTLNGGALGNDTTYHLYRYKKNDNTFQWHLENSLTPTIGDIKSALAYRRVWSGLTDGSGDLYRFLSKEINGGLFIYYYEFINDYNSAPTTTETLTTMSIPVGLKLFVTFGAGVSTISIGGKEYRFYSPDILDVAAVPTNMNMKGGNATGSEDVAGEFEVITNTSAQIAHRSDSNSGTLVINTISYKDCRNEF